MTSKERLEIELILTFISEFSNVFRSAKVRKHKKLQIPLFISNFIKIIMKLKNQMLLIFPLFMEKEFTVKVCSNMNKYLKVATEFSFLSYYSNIKISNWKLEID